MGMKAPAKNKNGLVIPPNPARITVERAQSLRDKSLPDRHHIYFPRVSFLENGELAYRFREHQFNSVWLPRFQHERIHRGYDPLVRKFPDYLIPSDDVMATFLDEAEILEGLGVNVRAVDMIGNALYEGRVKHIQKTLEHKDERIQNVCDHMRRIGSIAIIPRHIRQPYIEMGNLCLGRVA